MSHALGPPPGLDLAALPHSPRPPWLNRVDPRARIVAAVAFAFLLVACEAFIVLGAGLGVALLLAIMARLPLKGTLKRTIGVDLFIVFLLALLPFTTPGETWFHLGPLAATWEGFLLAAAIGIKAMGVILTLLALVGTMEPPELGYALSRLRVPEKLVHILLFTVRYLDVLQREYRRLRTAMKARAFLPRSDAHTWRTFGYLFGMVLVRSLERSERIHDAMKCRGFSGRFHLLGRLQWQWRDGVFAALFLLVLAALGVGEGLS